MKFSVNWSVVLTIAKRDLRGYFSSPTGYVFVTLFIFLSAAAAFWNERFFANNLANLDQLNGWFPFILLFFIPALTMNIWAEERKHGTDELLLTLPISDIEVVFGKYLATLGMYTASLILSISHVLVLFWLGSPDIGLTFGNFVGYWLSGAALLAVGMLASLLTGNLTVGFILGALFCSFFVFIDSAFLVLSDTVQRWFSPLGLFGAFGDFSRGVISLSGLLYFVSITGLFLYLNVILLSRRHWRQATSGHQPWTHFLVRGVAVVVALVSLNAIMHNAGLRFDVTAEQLHSLSNRTEELIDQLPADRPVLIQAYISPEVPRAYVETREKLISTLEELSAIGGSKVQVLLHNTEPFSEQAREAREKFNIGSRDIVSTESARTSSVPVYLGVAFTSGPREQVIEFFDRGLPVEYELLRSIRVVANSERRKIGVVTTQAKLFGGFDFESMQQTQPWPIVQELEKQYEVTQISAESPITADVDAVLAVLPSTLSQPELDNLFALIASGKPALILDDPLPTLDPMMSPIVPSDANSNPFQQRQGPPPKPKGDIEGFFRKLGVTWNSTQVAWDTYNPHPDLLPIQPEIVFVAEGNDGPGAFDTLNAAVAGLQEMVLMYPGFVLKAVDSKVDFAPLLRSSRMAGYHAWQQLVQQSFFGLGINRNPRRVPTGESFILGAHITGPIEGGQANVIFVPDVDFVSQQFFQMRASGVEGLNFDNVTFFLNAIDILAGDSSFVDLRKKRVKYRKLESVDAQTRGFVERRIEDEKKAEEEAQAALGEARERLNQKVAELQNRTDLDLQAKQIMVQNLQEVENRRFEVTRAGIESRKQATIQRAKENMESEIRSIQTRIRSLAVAIPPIPVLVMGILVFTRRRQRERDTELISRRRRS